MFVCVLRSMRSLRGGLNFSQSVYAYVCNLQNDIHIPIKTYICVYVCMYACMHVYVCVCVYIYMYIYIYTCIYVYIHTCMYVCMCTYEYTYMQPPKQYTHTAHTSQKNILKLTHTTTTNSSYTRWKTSTNS
jgi:hypothetical protein